MKAYPTKIDENGHRWVHENTVFALMMISFGGGGFLVCIITYIIFWAR